MWRTTLRYVWGEPEAACAAFPAATASLAATPGIPEKSEAAGPEPSQELPKTFSWDHLTSRSLDQFETPRQESSKDLPSPSSEEDDHGPEVTRMPAIKPAYYPDTQHVVETHRIFDMRQIWWQCFKMLLAAIRQTEGTVFGGAAAYWRQVREFRRLMWAWQAARPPRQEDQESNACMFLDPAVDPANFQKRASLRRPNDVDVWFASPRDASEAMTLIRSRLPGLVRIDPLRKGKDLDEPIYSSSPFARQLLRHRRFQVTFDAFSSLMIFPTLPSRLQKPVVLLLDCVFPVEVLPRPLAWPWQLSPYPYRAKCLGLYKGTEVGASDLDQRARKDWQPLASQEEQQPLWTLCEELELFKSWDRDDLELLCRQCVWAYVRRLHKELSEGNELPQAAFSLTGTDAKEIQRKDTNERQSWFALRRVLGVWQNKVAIKPNVLSFDEGRQFMQWRCPWVLDEEETESMGPPLVLC